jgi:ACS family hexuronate transporter-like MFS transporter
MSSGQIAASNSRMRWGMILLAFWATVVNYLDRQTLSVAAPVLTEQFGMSSTSYSRVVFAFLLAYTIMNGVSGPLIDRLGTRAGYGLCMLWWSGSSVLHAFANGPVSLGICRFLLGMGEAGNWPGAVKVVAEWFPEKERALASGIFNSGSSLGAILAPPVVAFLLLRLGWRWAFVLVGLAGFIWLAVWWPIYRTPEATTESDILPPVPTRELLRSRFVRSFTVSKIFIDPAWYFYVFWFPQYLKADRHFDMAAIGAYAWMPFVVAGLGNVFGGLLSRFLLNFMPLIQARKTAVTVFAILMMASIPAVFVQSVWLSMIFVSVAMAGYTGSLANMLALPADLFPKNAAASVYGIASMGAGFGGMIFSLITGWLLEHFSYTPAFICFGLIPLICPFVLWLFAGSQKYTSVPQAVAA